MQNPTPLFPGFHLPTLRRKPKSEKQKLLEEINRQKQKSLSQLSEFFRQFIPSHLFTSESTGAWSRDRVLNKKNTFWAFFSQVLDADGGCKEVIRKLQAVAALKSITLSSSTAGYCKARQKLAIDELVVLTPSANQVVFYQIAQSR